MVTYLVLRAKKLAGNSQRASDSHLLEIYLLQPHIFSNSWSAAAGCEVMLSKLDPMASPADR